MSVFPDFLTEMRSYTGSWDLSHQLWLIDKSTATASDEVTYLGVLIPPMMRFSCQRKGYEACKSTI
ncbi:MAG: hypothetical protein IPN08_08375 [Bacteroidales bacterium]|nr:hypothetical protein [Bacteroidales bacterium]